MLSIAGPGARDRDSHGNRKCLRKFAQLLSRHSDIRLPFLASPFFFAPVIFAFAVLARGSLGKPTSIMSRAFTALARPEGKRGKRRRCNLRAGLDSRTFWTPQLARIIIFFFPSFTPSRMMRHARSARFFADGNNAVRRVKLSLARQSTKFSRESESLTLIYNLATCATCFI